MSVEDEFRIRPGRIRSRGSRDSRTFVGQALAAAQKAGGLGAGPSGQGSVFGRGRPSSLNALRRVGGRSRVVVVKARVVRQRAGAPLAVHVRYLQREGVTRDGASGRLFGAEVEAADGAAFADHCAEDRHHFRFIVAPQDAAELGDLKSFTRDLMSQAEADLGTHLDWVAVDHWNTAHPHVHVLVRGVDQDGRDLVISRDYIGEGLRARASRLVTLELGLRTDQQIRRDLQAEVDADRWTKLDRALARDAAEGGVIDLRRGRDGAGSELRSFKLARLAKLQRMGLAERLAGERWRVSPDAEPTLRQLARRNDIIARIHDALGERATERNAADWRLESEPGMVVTGKLVARGLDDELSGSAFAVVDGVDGRTHHLALPDLDAVNDAPLGAVVEARWMKTRSGRRALTLAVRSDHTIEQQVTASGATWLDRQLVGREPAVVADHGFGREVRTALAARTDQLAAEGLAERAAGRVTFARNLLQTLRQRELDAAASRLSGKTGLAYRPAAEGEAVSGVVRQRVTLASGRFAMIDDGLGFTLVPWRTDLGRRLGQEVSGVALPGGGVDWTFNRQRGLGR